MKKLIFALCVLTPFTAGAAPTSAYVEMCEREELVCTAFIDGYMSAMTIAAWNIDTESTETITQMFAGCATTGVSIGQMQKVWTKYINDHPEELHLAARTTFRKSLIKAFPCDD